MIVYLCQLKIFLIILMILIINLVGFKFEQNKYA